MYDFRDGILLEKVVYKDDSCNFGYVLLYLLCLLLTWMWGVGWFSLFFYSYIFHEKPTFIAFIIIWGVFAISIAVIGFLNIKKSENEKLRKKKEKEDRERQMKEIMEAKNMEWWEIWKVLLHGMCMYYYHLYPILLEKHM